MMKKRVAFSFAALCAVSLWADEVTLAPITVESSTIMDMTEDLKTEVSTVNDINETTYQTIDPKNINEVLRTVPGVTADVRSGDTVEIHIRGVNQQEFMWEDTGVAVVIDGVPVMQNGGKVKINLDNIESIKVIKGGASYLYGPNALAGAVVITTKKPKNRDEIDLSADYGSYAYQNYRLTYNKATENFAMILNGSYRYTSGYWDMNENWTGSGNGKFTWYIDETSDITFGAEYTRKYEESSRGSVTGFTAAQEDPTGASDGDLPWNHDYWSDIQKYFVNYNKDFADGGNLLVNAYYYQDLYNYDSSPQDLDGDGQEDTYTLDNDEDIDQYGIKAEYRNRIGDLAYMIGLDIGRRELDDSWVRTETYTTTGWRPATYYEGESSRSDTIEDRFGLYTEGKYQATEALTLVANLRYDYEKYRYDVDLHDYDGTAWSDESNSADDSFSNLSWRLGFTYQLTENHTLYSSVSTGFRNPRIQDIYAGDFDPDSYVNNPDLDTEKTINYEIGLRGNFSLFDTDFRYEASIYQIDTKDIIGKVYGTYFWGAPNYGDKSWYDNVGDARTRGIELALHSDRSKRFSFDLAYSYMDAEYTSHVPFYVSAGGAQEYDITGKKLPRTPHHRLDLMSYFKLSDEWTLIAENYLQSNYYADETNLVNVPGYGIMNLQLRYNTTLKGNPFEFYVRADNIFDRHYFRTVYLFRDRNYDGVMDKEDASITVDPGRVYYVGVKYKF
ncbi:TonB-dependent receptor [Nitratifractor sp.]